MFPGHSENAALCSVEADPGPLALLWRASDERRAKNGTLSPWVSPYPTSFPLSWSSLGHSSHTAHPKWTHHTLIKNAQCGAFCSPPKVLLPLSFRKSTMSRLPFYWLFPEKKNIKISKIAPRELVRVTSCYDFKTWYFNYMVLWSILTTARLEMCLASWPCGQCTGQFTFCRLPGSWHPFVIKIQMLGPALC